MGLADFITGLALPSMVILAIVLLTIFPQIALFIPSMM